MAKALLPLFIAFLVLFALIESERLNRQHYPSQPTTEQISGPDQDETPDNQINAPLLISQETNNTSNEREAAEQQSEIDLIIESNRISSEDLAQQTRMADGTDSIAADTSMQVSIALKGLVLNGVGLAFLFVALILNWKATNAAKTSADAAVTAIKQDQGWIGIKYSSNPNVFGDPDQPDLIEYHFEIKNVGKSPIVAYKATIHSQTVPVEFNTTEIINEMRKGSPSFLAPGETIYRKWRMNRSMLDQFRSGEVEYMIYICCQYETIYGDTFLAEQIYRTVRLVTGGKALLTFANKGDRSITQRVNKDGTVSPLTIESAS